MINEIEALRKRLDEAIEREDIGSKEVLKISMELDVLIAEYYNIKQDEEDQKK